MRELRHLVIELWRVVKAFSSGEWERGVYKMWGMIYSSLYLIELLIRNRHAVECSYCGWEGNRFFPVLDHVSRTRKDAACPMCGSNDRYRLFLAFLRQSTDFFSATWKVLDVASPPYFLILAHQLDNLQYFSANLEFSRHITV